MSVYKNYRVPTGTLTSAELADGTVAAIDIANDAVSTDKLNSAGIAPVISGGSINGQSIGSTRASAINALLPTQTNKTGKILKSDGTNVSFTASDNVTFEINQVTHGFAVKDAIFFNGTNYVKAQANSAATLGTMIVSKVVDANNFEATLCGKISGLSGLNAGEYYFVSDSVAGGLMSTDSAPFSNPLLLALSATEAMVLPYRPAQAANEATILPAQTSNAGKYLKTDGTNSSWDAIDISTSDVSGVLTVAKGGTGVNGSTAANGKILIGNGSGYTLASVTGVSNEVVVTEGAGSIQLGLGTNAVTLTGTQSLTNKTLVNQTVTNFTETVYAPAAGTSFTVDLANGTMQKFTSNGNLTIMLPASAAGKSYVILVAYGGTHTLTFAGGTTIKWPGGTVPTATSANGKIDTYSFMCDGTNTYGVQIGANY